MENKRIGAAAFSGDGTIRDANVHPYICVTGACSLRCAGRCSGCDHAADLYRG